MQASLDYPHGHGGAIEFFQYLQVLKKCHLDICLQSILRKNNPHGIQN